MKLARLHWFVATVVPFTTMLYEYHVPQKLPLIVEANEADVIGPFGQLKFVTVAVTPELSVPEALPETVQV
ncbi:hypothetical protein D3C80_930440 [compost metagenome]